MQKSLSSIVCLLIGFALSTAACSSSGGGSNSESGTDGPMPQTMFHPSCEEPTTSAQSTCDNFCTKIARCSQGLCAAERSDGSLCEASIFAEQKARCMDTCDADVLLEEPESVTCLFEKTCAEVFVDKACDATTTLNCDALVPVPDCDYIEDGECDEAEGTGLCPEGSDVVDCDANATSGPTGERTSTGFGYTDSTGFGDGTSTGNGTSTGDGTSTGGGTSTGL